MVDSGGGGKEGGTPSYANCDAVFDFILLGFFFYSWGFGLVWFEPTLDQNS